MTPCAEGSNIRKPIGMADVCDIFARRHKALAVELADEYETTVETVENIWARKSHRYWTDVQLRREYYSPKYVTVTEYRGRGIVSYGGSISSKGTRVMSPGESWS